MIDQNAYEFIAKRIDLAFTALSVMLERRHPGDAKFQEQVEKANSKMQKAWDDISDEIAREGEVK
jgi:hypothetical protein